MQNSLPEIVIGKNNQITTTSLNIAEVFGKRHADVLRSINNLTAELPETDQRNFALVDFVDKKGEKQPCYNVTRDGFTLLVMGFTGKKALAFKLAYINQFNAMEAALSTIMYRKHDAKAQIEAMAVIGHLLPPEEAKEAISYIKANTVVNKLVSTVHGFPKMLKKDDMNLAMLNTRTDVLNKYVKLFELGFSNSEINGILSAKFVK